MNKQLPDINEIHKEAIRFKELQKSNRARLNKVGTLVLMYKLASIKPPQRTIIALKRLQQEKKLLEAKPIIIDDLEAKLENYQKYGSEDLLEEITSIHESIKTTLTGINRIDEELNALEETIDSINVDDIINDLINEEETIDEETGEIKSQTREPVIQTELVNIVKTLPKNYDQETTILEQINLDYFLLKPVLINPALAKKIRLKLINNDWSKLPVMRELEYDVSFLSYLQKINPNEEKSIFKELTEETYEKIKNNLLHELKDQFNALQHVSQANLHEKANENTQNEK